MSGSIVKDHKDLNVWLKAMELAESLYVVTEQLPSLERFGLLAQIRRAAISVPSNIAEGAARGSSADFVRFLNMSLGSLAELETQLMLAQRLKMLSPNETPYATILEARKMIIRLIQALRARRID